MERIANDVKRGRYLFCPKGSHLTIYDDQEVYMAGIIRFLLDVDSGKL
jgi:proline iminopeptidase